MRPWLFYVVAVICGGQDPGTFRVSQNLVLVTCSVAGPGGRPVLDMTVKDFALFDNGKPRAIEHLWREIELPLTVGLVVDVSGTQAKFIAEHRHAVSQFLAQVLGPQDKAFIVAIGPSVKLITGPTSSLKDLEVGVAKLGVSVFDPKGSSSQYDLGDQCPAGPPPNLHLPQGVAIPNWWCGGTLLWNGVYSSAQLEASLVTGRRALALLTDGMDTGARHGAHTLKDAIEAAQATDTAIYTIYYPANFPKFFTLGSASGLRRLSYETGGRAFDSQKTTSGEIFADIEHDLRTLYVVAFTMAENERDGKFHRLEVKSKRGGVTIRARKEYLASSTK